MALELCTLHPRLDRDLLLSAAIVHDLGKTREFTYGAEIERSREGRLLGHIELGLRVIAEHAPAASTSERRLALEHCVMLHHGADAASGQRFASPEALALYRLNALDAQVKGALEHGGAGRPPPEYPPALSSGALRGADRDVMGDIATPTVLRVRTRSDRPRRRASARSRWPPRRAGRRSAGAKAAVEARPPEDERRDSPRPARQQGPVPAPAPGRSTG